MSIALARHRVFAALALPVLLAACGEEDRTAPTAGTRADVIAFHRWSERFTSSGRLTTPSAWAGVADEKARTVLCVEANPPDAKAAERAGLACFHVPLPHDGIPREAQLQLLRVARDRPGGIHIAGTRGSVRAAAAIGLLRMSAEGTLLDEVLRDLGAAGSGRLRPGVLRSLARFQAPSQRVLDAVGRVPARVPMEGLKAAMVEVDARLRVLDTWGANGWERPTRQATLGAAGETRSQYDDASAAQLATQIAALFRDGVRAPAGGGDDPMSFERIRSDAEAAAALVAYAVRRLEPARASASLGRLRAACDQCHRRYR